MLSYEKKSNLHNTDSSDIRVIFIECRITTTIYGSYPGQSWQVQNNAMKQSRFKAVTSSSYHQARGKEH